jgi:hypothetical protein
MEQVRALRGDHYCCANFLDNSPAVAPQTTNSDQVNVQCAGAGEPSSADCPADGAGDGQGGIGTGVHTGCPGAAGSAGVGCGWVGEPTRRLPLAQQLIRADLAQTPRDDFEKGTPIGSKSLMLGPGTVQDMGARSRCATLVYECASNNVKVLIVFMVLNCAHPVSGVPSHQHRYLSSYGFS